jgi:YihY family inner membrane protein
VVNIAERAIRRVDRFQQSHTASAFVFGVVKKFGDDRGSGLCALLTYYGFMSLFPLLLVLTTILGFVGNARIEDNVIGTTLQQFPVVGQQIGKNAAHPLDGSGFALVVGLIGLLYGALGSAQAAQHAMAQVWNVPGAARPGFVARLGRGLGLFAALAVGMGLSAAASGIATVTGQPFAARALGLVVSAVVNSALFIAVFRLTTPRSIALRDLLVGAVLGGLAYTILLAFGTALVQHQLRNAEAVYGQFAFVLGLIGWLYLVFQVVLYAAEVNVVRARRLWPRSIVQPPLTTADQRVLRDIAHQEARRPEQRVGVGFDPEGAEEARADAIDRSPARVTED